MSNVMFLSNRVVILCTYGYLWSIIIYIEKSILGIRGRKWGIIMKKKIVVLIVLVLLMTLIFSGCGKTKENSAISTQAMQDYYVYYNNGDFDGCLKIMHPQLIDAIGGEQITKEFLAARLEIYGAVLEYDTNQTGFETSNGESIFYYTITVKYSSGEEFTEIYEVLVSNGVAQMVRIDV